MSLFGFVFDRGRSSVLGGGMTEPLAISADPWYIPWSEHSVGVNVIVDTVSIEGFVMLAEPW